MRKIIIAMLMALPFASCGQAPTPIDFSANILIFVKNEAGENLLYPAFEGNILDDDISIDYNEETFILKNQGNVSMDLGFYNAGNSLEFGPFPSDHKSSRSFIINWGDGTSDEIKFDLYVTYRKKGKEPTVHRSIWLNGELQSDDSLVVTIVK